MSFIHLLLTWYKANHRKLPWRESQEPYRVWLSEIMLQQTRVNQGIGYYHRFLEKFDNVFTLAKAEEEQVLNLWQGLGYYSRARNLHKAAKIIVHEHDGRFPNSFQSLLKLPGIGKYTAAAIASICFGEKVPAIDGNAYRVYARNFGLDKDISDNDAHRYFFEKALQIMPEKNAGDFNQAVMELGATICLPKNPQCMFCPVQKDCVAFATGKVHALPLKTKKVKIQKKYIHYYFIHHQNKFLIQKRYKKGIWQNMYDFPSQELKTDTIMPELFQEFNPEFQYEIKHILTHRHLFIRFYTVQVDAESFEIIGKDYQTITSNDVEYYPFPKPMADFLIQYFREA